VQRPEPAQHNAAPPQTLDIHPLQPNEFERLQESIPSPHHAERLTNQQTGESRFLVAWVVGQLVLLLKGSPEGEVIGRAGSVPCMQDVAVQRELRSRGIGSRLIAEAERLVSAAGLKDGGLAVSVSNRDARRLYERLGYQDSGAREFEISWSYEDAQGKSCREFERCVYLRKTLDS
jgi:ribosomal protein S18 acetylase RimI-like enzyme